MEAFEAVPDQHLSPDRPQPTTWHKLLLVLRVLCTTVMTVIANIFVISAKLLRPFIGRKNFRKMCDYMQQSWFDAAFVVLNRTRIHVYGSFKTLHEDDNDKRPRIVISNHATDVDWAYLWMLAQTCKTPRSGHVKVMLKEGVKHIPLYGFLLDNLEFLWMKRNWETDRMAIHQRIQKLASDDQHLWIVMFPEGMTINTKSLSKAREFAKQEKRPLLDLVLLPREKGLSAILEATKDLNPEIIDVTMAFESFSGEVPTWEMGYERNKDHLVPNSKKLVMGMSGEVFMDVRTIDASVVVNHAGGIKGWLDERWQRKDNLLKHFVQHGEFSRESCSDYEVKVPHGSLMKLALTTLWDIAFVYGMTKLLKNSWMIGKDYFLQLKE